MPETEVHPALKLAREARRQPTEQESLAFAAPARLHVRAKGDHEIFRHAMIEAGFYVSKEDDKPFDPCPICGWSVSSEEA